MDQKYMREAIRMMRQAGIVNKTGGPFGAVIVRNGEILAVAGNSVMKDHDPTAHAEINAIRAACSKVGSHDLSGAIMYTSCECCQQARKRPIWRAAKMTHFGGHSKRPTPQAPKMTHLAGT